MRKSIYILCTLLAMMFVITCTPFALAETTDLTGTEVTIWYMPQYEGFDDRMSTDLAQKVKDEYGIILNTEMLTWDAGPEKITVSMATGATPDILLDGATRIMPAIAADQVVELTDVQAYIQGKVYDSVPGMGTFDGKFVYLPVNINAGYNMCVNVSLVKSLGLYDMLPQDKAHWSYEDFLAFCRAVREKGKDQGIYATQLFAGSKSSDSVYYSFIMSAGGNVLNADHTAMAVNNDQTMQALGLFKTMIDEQLVPDGAATTIDNGIRPNWYSQKLAFMLVNTGVGEIAKVKQQVDSGDIEPFDVDIYEYPTPDGKADPHVMSWGSTGACVFKNGGDEKKILAAQKVLEVFLSMDDLNSELWVNTGSPSVLKDLTVDYGSESFNEQAARAAQSTTLYSDSTMGVLEGFWSDLRDTFYPQLQAYFVGEKTIDQMMADWETAGNELIAKKLAE